MSLAPTLALLALITPTAQPRPAASAHGHGHLSAQKLNDIATILAHDEGWPLGNPEYTLDRMTPDVDDGFDSIGVYRKAHLVRMYSIDRTTGQIVDFMRGCQVFRFDNTRAFREQIRAKTHTPPLTDRQLARKAGCPSLTVVNSRWVKP